MRIADRVVREDVTRSGAPWERTGPTPTGPGVDCIERLVFYKNVSPTLQVVCDIEVNAFYRSVGGAGTRIAYAVVRWGTRRLNWPIEALLDHGPGWKFRPGSDALAYGCVKIDRCYYPKIEVVSARNFWPKALRAWLFKNIINRLLARDFYLPAYAHRHKKTLGWATNVQDKFRIPASRQAEARSEQAREKALRQQHAWVYEGASHGE